MKTASRIDRPAPFAPLTPGAVPVAGVAWAQGRGIRAVEVRVDDGGWQPATLLPVPSVDTWVQWRYDWPATPGSHSLSVRATPRVPRTRRPRRWPRLSDTSQGPGTSH